MSSRENLARLINEGVGTWRTPLEAADAILADGYSKPLAKDFSSALEMKVAPLGYDVTAPMVQEVWDTFVKPGQDADKPQSGEMRVLIAILRGVYAALLPDES